MAKMAADNRQNGEVKGILQTHHKKKRLLTAPDTVETPEYEAPRGTQEEGSRNETLARNPTFSLAGSGAQNPNNTNQGPYTDQEYQSYNPQYGKPDDGPTWSLAQPLPHIVRPGMRHGALPEDRKEDKEAFQNGSGADLDPELSPEAKKQRSVESRMNRVNAPQDDGFFNTWSKIRHKVREPLAEWLGVSPPQPPTAQKPSPDFNRTPADNNRNDYRPLRNPIKLHLPKPSRNLRFPERSLGLRVHGSNLHNRRNIRRPHEPRRHNHALRLPWLPSSPVHRLYRRAASRRHYGGRDRVRAVPRCDRGGCVFCGCSAECERCCDGVDYRAEVVCGSCYGVFYRVCG
jgi:hypothetical protein